LLISVAHDWWDTIGMAGRNHYPGIIMQTQRSGGMGMAIATSPMTLQDYLNFEDGTDTRYELVEGELISMSPESDLHDRIASFL
jgi:hypothetical protein